MRNNQGISQSPQQQRSHETNEVETIVTNIPKRKKIAFFHNTRLFDYHRNVFWELKKAEKYGTSVNLYELLNLEKK